MVSVHNSAVDGPLSWVARGETSRPYNVGLWPVATCGPEKDVGRLRGIADMDGPAVGSARSLMTRSGNRAGLAKIEKQLIHVFALMSRIKS